MPDPFFEAEEKAARADDELERAERQAVTLMVGTEGWDIVKKRVLTIKKEHEHSLKSIPPVVENLGEIALAQSKANACDMLLDIVEGYLRAPEN